MSKQYIVKIEISILKEALENNREELDLLCVEEVLKQWVRIYDSEAERGYSTAFFWGEMTVPTSEGPEYGHDLLKHELNRNINTKWLRIDHLPWDAEIDDPEASR